MIQSNLVQYNPFRQPMAAPKPAPTAYQQRGPMQQDPYSNLKRTNPQGFFGPTLMRQYGGNTQVLQQRFDALKSDQPNVNLSYQNQYNPVQSGPYDPQGGPPSSPQAGMGMAGGFDPGQVWQMLLRMFGQMRPF